MAFEDELPTAPQQVSSPQQAEAKFDDSIDPSMFEGVGKMGDAMPVGTFHFRLLSFSKRTTEVGEPYYALEWSCQEEPHTGRKVFENCPWVRTEDTAAAKAGDAKAKQKLSGRLMRANTLMDACSFKPDGSRGFESFLADHPEVKLTLGLDEIKEKDSEGKWTKGTGSFRNNVKKYVSVRRPS